MKNSLTKSQINAILKMPNFCNLFHGGKFGNQKLGGKAHRDFLAQQMQDNLDIFLEKPEFQAYVDYAQDNYPSSDYKPMTVRANRIYDNDLIKAIEADTAKFNVLMKTLLTQHFEARKRIKS